MMPTASSFPNRRDEFLKDILGLANGNSHIIRKTKYLIIGADNEKFDDDGCRVLYCVDYKVPSSSEIASWLKDACAPAIVGLECEKVLFKEFELCVISIPPTFNLHETTREFNASGHFQKHVVFMRQDEHTVPASVRDGIAIQPLKYLHRQEISNPPAVWIGGLAGGIAAFITVAAYMNSVNLSASYSETSIRIGYTLFGAFFGGSIGWFIKEGNEIRYSWRYASLFRRIIVIGFLLIVIIAFILIIR